MRRARNIAFTIFGIVLLSASIIHPAAADPIISGIEDTYWNDWSKILHTSSPLTSVDNDLDDPLVYLQSSTPPDVFRIQPTRENFKAIVQAELLEPFEPSEKMKEEIKNFPPVIQSVMQELVCNEDGLLLGYPKYLSLQGMLFWVPDAWNASPFKDVTPPTSFTEVLDFLELYLNTPHDGFCFYYDISEDKNPLRNNWMSMLIECYSIQCRNHGISINFNNEEFIELAQRTKDLFSQLCKEEPNKKKQKGRQLFCNYYHGYTENGKDTFSWDNLIPWRITSEQRPLVNVNLWLYCVRKGSEYADYAQALFDNVIDHRKDLIHGQDNWLAYLYVNKTWINVSEYNKQIDKQYGKKWKCLYMTQEYIDSIWRLQEHAEACMEMENYLSAFIPWETHKEYFRTIDEFDAGSIQADEFAQRITELGE